MLEDLFNQEKVDEFKFREAYKVGREIGIAEELEIAKAEVEIGIAEGEVRLLTKLIIKNLARGMSPEQIAEDLDCSLEYVRKIMEITEPFLDTSWIHS